MLKIGDPSEVAFSIVQIGTGGTGSRLVQQIAEMISLGSYECSYLIADPDVVEKKNLKNQMFIRSDVGKKKANVLGERYASAYQFPIEVPEKYTFEFVQTVEDLNSLFEKAVLSIPSLTKRVIKVLVGCVDNTFSRDVFHQWFKSCNDALYIDVGNHSVKKYSLDYYSLEELDELRTEEDFEEGEENTTSGYDGQVYVGIKFSGVQLSNCYGDINQYDPEEKDNPAEQSCQENVVQHPQRGITNATAAHAVRTVLSPLLFEGAIYHTYVTFNAKLGFMKTKEYELEI